MNEKKKRLIIQLTAFAFAIVVGLIGVLYGRGVFDFTFIDRPTDTTAPTDDVSAADTETAIPDVTTDDNVTPIPDEVRLPNYDESFPAIMKESDAAALGMKRYQGEYSGGAAVIALIPTDGVFADDYAVRDDVATRVVKRDYDARGAYHDSETYETKPRPVLAPYFGYFIYDNGRALQLLDARGRVLMNDITGYAPTGYRDLSGHPLFKKDGVYYYYYNGADILPDTIVLDRVTEQDILQYADLPLPEAYYNVDADTEFTPTLPETAGMVECTVDENYLNTIAIPSSYESGKKSADLWRLCEHRVIRTVTNQAEIDARNAEIEKYKADVANGTVGRDSVRPQPIEPIIKEDDLGCFWGYVDADGNYKISPQYALAYDFSADGYAVIADPEGIGSGRLILINESAGTAFDAFAWGNIFYDPELGNLRVRDSNILPETTGAENTGMLMSDRGLVMVRRRLALLSGGKVRSEYNALVSGRGQYFNIPDGYELIAYSDGAALLERDGRYGYMDHTGTWIAQPTLTHAEPFCEGLAACGYDGHIGLIDLKGGVALPMIFDYVSSCRDGAICAFSRGHGWSIFNKMSTQTYEQTSNPIMAIKKRLVAQAKFDEFTLESEAAGSDIPQPPETTAPVPVTTAPVTTKRPEPVTEKPSDTETTAPETEREPVDITPEQ